MSPATVTRFAPAKVNLALAVAPARARDGLHPICSWIAPIDLGDTLTVHRAAAGGPSAHTIRWAADAPRPSAIDWPIEKDLAVRAHRALETECGRELPVEMLLEKRTPVGAGLGGGSSDGAAALLAIRELFGLPIPDERLRAIGLSLGADVPVFLPPDEGAPAVVEGVGDVIVRTPRVCAAAGGAQRLLLVMPPFGCPTGAVYRAFDDAPPTKFRAEAVCAMARRAVVDWEELFNDLAAPAERVAPRLRELRERVSTVTGLPAHVTGSGSAMFVVLEEGDACERFALGAAHAIEESEPGAAARVVEVC